MEVQILEEAGYESARYGFSLSYKDRGIKRGDWMCVNGADCDWHRPCGTCDLQTRGNKYDGVLKANKGRDKGHNKFLRQLQVWVDIEAPRYWWSEFDTYKIGTVAQSESTMHTLSRRDITTADFENGDAIEQDGLMYELLEQLNMHRTVLPINTLKGYLPEAYLQRRVVSMNYAVIREIIKQRKNHKLPEWKIFIDSLVKDLDYPELLEDLL